MSQRIGGAAGVLRARKGPSFSVGPDGAWSDGLLKAQVYERILLDLILGELKPLEALDERVLSERYASGVAGVREALGRLALEGLVVRRPRVGTVAAPLDIREIEHAFEVRRMLEGPTAALAARNATSEDRAAVRAAFDGAEDAVAAGDLRSLLLMDRGFHRAVAFATGNPTLARYVTALQNLATRFWIHDMRRQSPAEQLADVALHRELADAVARGDAEAAERAAGRLVGDPPSAYPRAR